MEIHTQKEVINKTRENIPQLVEIIKTKEQEMKDLLTQEKTNSPLTLRGNAYETFQKTRKEILATLDILNKLGYTGKAGDARKMFKNGPFATFKNIDVTSPKIKREIHQLIEEKKKISQAAEVDINELRKIQFTIEKDLYHTYFQC
ncbi:MAG: hypothetical protein WC606_03600 [Candidatus Absconditabacterales bacterium]